MVEACKKKCLRHRTHFFLETSAAGLPAYSVYIFSEGKKTYDDANSKHSQLTTGFPKCQQSIEALLLKRYIPMQTFIFKRYIVPDKSLIFKLCKSNCYVFFVNHLSINAYEKL